MRFWNCEYGARFAVGSVSVSASDAASPLVEVVVVQEGLCDVGEIVEIQPMGRGTTQALKGSKGRLWSVMPGW